MKQLNYVFWQFEFDKDENGIYSKSIKNKSLAKFNLITIRLHFYVYGIRQCLMNFNLCISFSCKSQSTKYSHHFQLNFFLSSQKNSLRNACFVWLNFEKYLTVLTKFNANRFNNRKMSNLFLTTSVFSIFQGIRISKKCAKRRIPPFYAEHPFLYFIGDDKRCPIFSGRLTHPKQIQFEYLENDNKIKIKQCNSSGTHHLESKSIKVIIASFDFQSHNLNLVAFTFRLSLLSKIPNRSTLLTQNFLSLILK